MKMNDKTKSAVFALSAALIWGIAFAFQRMGAERLGPLSFNACRGVLATLALWLLTLLRSRSGIGAYPTGEGRRFWLGGLLCGVLLWAGSNLQQYGLSETEAGAAGFLTSLYIVLVPLLEVIVLRRRVPALLWISVLLALSGLYLLSVGEGFAVRPTDAVIMLSALVFAVHILAVDRFVKDADPVALCCVQFAVVSLLSAAGAAIWEHPSWADVKSVAPSLLYVGVVSGGLGYASQMAAQKYGKPETVSLLCSMESLFSVLGGAVILSERLTLRELAGCAVMFCAVLLSQMPENLFAKKAKTR